MVLPNHFASNGASLPDQPPVAPNPPTAVPVVALPADLVGQLPPLVVDAHAAAEQRWWHKMWKKEHAEVTGMYLDIVLRLLMCAALLWICWAWLDRICGIVEKQTEDGKKSLSDPVLIALLTTTTANILGLLLIVVGYLFPKRIGEKSPPA